MGNKYIFLIFLSLFCKNTFSQNFTGVIADGLGNPILNASISVKDSTNNTLTFGFSKSNGFFSVKKPYSGKSKLIEIKKYGYQTLEIDVNDFKDGLVYQMIKITELKEVVVTASEKPITIKKDTTTYDVGRYKDGTEKSIEDVLKKLPGITVEESGEIKFKGRSIDKVLIEGDDIFNRNYLIGTRNISAGILYKVEAIERFSENNVLRNIEDSDRIALNLKLKNNTNDFSGSALAGLGYEDKYLYDFNVLNVSKTNKNFSIFQYNNIGENNSQYDFLDNSSFERVLNEKLYLDKVMNVPITFFPFKNNVLHQNNTLINSINNFYRIDSLRSVRINLNYSGDGIKINNTQNDKFDLNDSLLVNNFSNSFKKDPIVLNSNIKYLVKKMKSNFEMEANIEGWDISEDLAFRINDKINKNTLVTEDFSYFINTNYSFLIGKNTALVYDGIYAKQNYTQEYKFLDKILFQNEEIDLQSLDATKLYVKNDLSLNGKVETMAYKFSIGYKYEKQVLNSLMISNSSERNINNEHLISNSVNLSGNIKIPHKKFSFNSDFDLFYDKSAGENTFFINLKTNIIYLVNAKSNLTLKFDLINQPTDVLHLYDNFIFNNFQSLTKNTGDFNFIRKTRISLNYKYYNLISDYKIEYSLKYSNRNLSFVNDINFDDSNLYLINSQLLNRGTNITESDLGIEFYVNALRQKVSYSNRSSRTEFLSNVQSETRLIETYRSSNEINFISLFRGIFNFSNTAKYSYTKNNFSEIQSFENKTSIILLPSDNLFFKVSNHYIVSDLKQSNAGTNLLDFEASCKINKFNSISLNVYNIVNEKYLGRKSSDEFSETEFKQRITPANFIIKYSFNF